MSLKENLQFLRKQNGYSQEQLAELIKVARQTVSKWENGQAVPDLNILIQLSKLYGVTIDCIVKEKEECNLSLSVRTDFDINEIADFLILAKQNTYAAKGKEVKACRTASHDFSYENGSGYAYYDTYLGGECFAGEEAVWHKQVPIWSMNYAGRVTGEGFEGDFLKEALMAVPKELPFRGPEIYSKGDYFYHCKVDGGFVWFQGYEEIFYRNNRIYECCFHGGTIR